MTASMERFPYWPTLATRPYLVPLSTSTIGRKDVYLAKTGRDPSGGGRGVGAWLEASQPILTAPRTSVARLPCAYLFLQRQEQRLALSP